MAEHDPNDKDRGEKLNLVEVARVHGPVEAEVIKNFLESEGISCFFKGLMLQSIYPFSADGLGEIKIFVPEKDLELAKKLLENKEFGPEPD